MRTLYKLAGQAGQDGAARDQIAYIVSQFVSFQQLQRPLLQAFEDVAEVAAKFPAIEQEAAALRAQVGERDAGLAAAQLRADAAEARLADALAEIEGQRAQIAELAERRDEREAMRAEIEARGTRCERRAAGDARELGRRRPSGERRASARRCVPRLHGAVGQLLRDEARGERTQQRESAAASSGTASRGRSAARDAGEDRGARRSTCRCREALEAEVGTLRGRLAQAEGEATERRAAAAALEAQIATLQDTLTAAREVGKAAIAAFRLDIAAPAKPHRPGGWRRGIMRFFGAQPSF